MRKQRTRKQTTGQPTEAQTSVRREARVLLVDDDLQSRSLFEACALQGERVLVFNAAGFAEARQCLHDLGPIDLVVINPALSDGDGLELVRQIDRDHRLTGVIMLSDSPSADAAITAMRAGACDYLVKPLDLEDTNHRLRAALARMGRSTQQARRVRKLRRLCKKLNKARLDISEQVDVLCNDLVTAYQELAEQMHHVVHSSEYQALVRDELDLEQVLRSTLEFLVKKVGPTNAAIFLPATMDEYTVGGYVNYDCPSDSATMLLDHLADVLAPRLTDSDDVVHINDDATLTDWLGDDAAYLAGTDVLAFAARSQDESLAVIALFRDNDTPFSAEAVETCQAIGPLLGEALAKVIKIHHRHLPDSQFGESEGGDYDEWFEEDID